METNYINQLAVFQEFVTGLTFLETEKAQVMQYKMRLRQLPQCHLILNLDLYSCRALQWTYKRHR